MQERMAAGFEFCWFLIRRFLADHGPNSAAALTYTTLFAVVPLMTVTFAMLSAVPAFQDMGEVIQSFIFRNFVPAAGSALQEHLRGFSTQARQLTWVGILFLMVSALLMMVTIEKAFNTIWRVQRPRRGVSSFLIYWAILSLGPLLLGVGFAISTYIASFSLLSGPDALIGTATLFHLMPPLLSVAAFTLLYAAVPNTRVPVRHALLGGVFCAALFEVAKQLFSLWVGFFPGYQLIYGAFASVPLFLLWVYLCWMIVLLGAELVCNLSAPRAARRRGMPRLLALFGVLRLLHDAQVQGRPLRSADLKKGGWAMADEQWHELIDFLERERLVCAVGGGAWVLCRDLRSYPVLRLIRYSPWPMPRPEQLPGRLEEAWYPALRECLQRLYDCEERAFEAMLGDWLNGEERGEVA